jgi:hypothetical protein
MIRSGLPLVIAMTVSVACGSTSSSTNVAPSPVRCAVAATPTPSTFPATGGSGTLVVSSERECSWSASSPASWISLLPPTAGQGDGKVRYTVAPNLAASSRRGSVVLGSQSADITQEAAACRFAFEPSSIELASGEQTAAVNVRVAAGCAWTAKAAVSWITIVDGAQGNGPGQVRFRTAVNAAVEPRSGSIEIAGQRVAVRQFAGLSCTYGVEPASAKAGPEQTTGNLSVRADAGCPWTAISDQPWLTIVAGQSGSGSGQIGYQAAANSTNSNRTGHITLNTSVFTFEQSACSYTIAPASQSFPGRGGTGTIDVGTQGRCAWSAGTNDAWIDITSGANGSGDGRVTYEVQPNERTGARTGTIVVAGQPFAVTQQGEASISGRARSVDGTCPNRRFTVNGQRIRTTSSTDYEKGTCGDIANGVAIRVKGIIGSDGVLTAIEVEF